MTAIVADILFGRGLDTLRRRVEIDHFHRDRVHYVPSGWRDLARVLPRRDIGSSDVFVDFGSDKGGVVCQAACYPFARVIGVEISDNLNRIAAANIARHLKLIDQCPVMEDYVLATGRFRLAETVKGKPGDPDRIDVFESST